MVEEIVDVGDVLSGLGLIVFDDQPYVPATEHTLLVQIGDLELKGVL